MLRVAHLNAGNLYGGIERFLVTLAELCSGDRALRQRFLLTHEGRFSQELRRAGAAVEIVGPARLSRPWTVVAARRRARAALQSFQPEVVIAHDIWPLLVLGPSAAGWPLFFYQHMAAGRTLLERCGSAIKIDAIISNSHFSARTAELLFPRVPVSVVRYPVSEPLHVDRASVRRSLGIGTEEIVIIQVSRFERWKGHLLLAEALKQIRSKRPWRVWIVGGASRPSERKLRAEIEQSVIGFPKGSVALLGERADVPVLMQAADIFCQPNIGPEPFGLVFVEALAAGLPVVTTRMGGALEIVDETVGIVTEPEAADVARALDSLLENADLRRSLGTLGPARARELCGPDRAVASLKAALCRGTDPVERRGWRWV